VRDKCRYVSLLTWDWQEKFERSRSISGRCGAGQSRCFNVRDHFVGTSVVVSLA